MGLQLPRNASLEAHGKHANAACVPHPRHASRRGHPGNRYAERGEKIGRIYRGLAVGGGHAWNWTVYPRGPTGRAPTLESAQAAFKAAWGTCEPR
jgi:hypothetical protein